MTKRTRTPGTHHKVLDLWLLVEQVADFLLPGESIHITRKVIKMGFRKRKKKR